MNDDRIYVNSAELRTSAAKLTRYVTEMSNTLNQATRTINDTANKWQSAAADNLRGRYLSLSGKFNDFFSAITKYAEFLNKTADSYESADQAISKQAEEVLNEGYNTAG